MRLNRKIEITLSVLIDGVRTIIPADPDGGNVLAQIISQLPRDYSMSVSKSFSSNNDRCTITTTNPTTIETYWDDPIGYFVGFENAEISFSVNHTTETDQSPPNFFTGDLINVNIDPSESISDQSVSITLTAGKRATSQAWINQNFPPETTYKEIVKACFLVYQEQFGWDAPQIIDPDDRLEKSLEMPKTIHRQISKVLDDISRDLQFIWSVDALNDRGLLSCYFVDKRFEIDPMLIYGAEHEVNSETGKLGLSGFNSRGVQFRHIADPVLNIGQRIMLSDSPTKNTAATVEMRIEEIQAQLSNSDSFTYLANGSYWDAAEGMVKLAEDKLQTSAKVY